MSSKFPIGPLVAFVSVLVCAALVLGVDIPRASGKQPAAALCADHSLCVQRVEMVYTRVCLEEIQAGADFQLHVPVDTDGKEDTDRMRTTGRVKFVMKGQGCGKLNVYWEPKQ